MIECGLVGAGAAAGVAQHLGDRIGQGLQLAVLVNLGAALAVQHVAEQGGLARGIAAAKAGQAHGAVLRGRGRDAGRGIAVGAVGQGHHLGVGLHHGLDLGGRVDLAARDRSAGQHIFHHGQRGLVGATDAGDSGVHKVLRSGRGAAGAVVGVGHDFVQSRLRCAAAAAAAAAATTATATAAAAGRSAQSRSSAQTRADSAQAPAAHHGGRSTGQRHVGRARVQTQIGERDLGQLGRRAAHKSPVPADQGDIGRLEEFEQLAQRLLLAIDHEQIGAHPLELELAHAWALQLARLLDPVNGQFKPHPRLGLELQRLARTDLFFNEECFFGGGIQILNLDEHMGSFLTNLGYICTRATSSLQAPPRCRARCWQAGREGWASSTRGLVRWQD